ncbi:MAG: hypothetical protein ABI977_14390 [Acidobacteriota bacterium]
MPGSTRGLDGSGVSGCFGASVGSGCFAFAERDARSTWLARVQAAITPTLR